MIPATDIRSLSVLLRKLDSIAALSDEEHAAIRSLPVRYRMIQAGQDIACEGDRPAQCCLVLDGWACRYKLLGGGRRQIVSFHVPGDIPDLQSLHLPTMDHSLGTLTDATVAIIPHERLRDLMRRFPRIGDALWRDTLIDAAIVREWMIGMGRKSASAQIAHLFCELYLKLEAIGLARDHRYRLPITQVELGDALGLSNVHVNRVLQEMRARGLITLQSHILVIRAWEELIRTSEFDPGYLHIEKRAPARAGTGVLATVRIAV